MKILIASCLLLFYSFTNHDVQVAIFKIYQEENKLCFDVVFEQDDIEKTFAERQIKYSPETIQQYLTDNFIIKANGKQSILKYNKVESKARHIYVSGNLSNTKKKIKTINIKNTCLLNIEGHSNIIELRLRNQERDFLINNDRKEIEVKL